MKPKKQKLKEREYGFIGRFLFSFFYTFTIDNDTLEKLSNPLNNSKIFKIHLLHLQEPLLDLREDKYL